MLYREKMREERRHKLKVIINHPYFGFIALGLLMLLFQILYFLNVSGFGISTIRAFGYTMIYIIIGLGFSILLGYGGLASLGTAGFVGLGTYFLGYFSNRLNLPFIIILAISLVLGVIIGGIIGFISLRIEGMYLAIITLGLSQILNEVFKNAVNITRGTSGLRLEAFKLFTFELSREMVFIFVIFALVITMILTLNIINSPTGRALSAMKNSDSAAQAMGISILKYRLTAFVIATVYAVFAGILYMAYISFTIPTNWNLAFSLSILAAVVVGGSRSIFGVVLGTFMIFGLDIAVLQKIPYFVQNPSITLIFNGLLIILVVIFYPGGLIRLLGSLKVKIVSLYKKYKRKWKEYRYGED